MAPPRRHAHARPPSHRATPAARRRPALAQLVTLKLPRRAQHASCASHAGFGRLPTIEDSSIGEDGWPGPANATSGSLPEGMRRYGTSPRCQGDQGSISRRSGRVPALQEGVECRRSSSSVMSCARSSAAGRMSVARRRHVSRRTSMGHVTESTPIRLTPQDEGITVSVRFVPRSAPCRHAPQGAAVPRPASGRRRRVHGAGPDRLSSGRVPSPAPPATAPAAPVAQVVVRVVLAGNRRHLVSAPGERRQGDAAHRPSPRSRLPARARAQAILFEPDHGEARGEAGGAEDHRVAQRQTRRQRHPSRWHAPTRQSRCRCQPRS